MSGRGVAAVPVISEWKGARRERESRKEGRSTGKNGPRTHTRVHHLPGGSFGTYRSQARCSKGKEGERETVREIAERQRSGENRVRRRDCKTDRKRKREGGGEGRTRDRERVVAGVWGWFSGRRRVLRDEGRRGLPRQPSASLGLL